ISNRISTNNSYLVLEPRELDHYWPGPVNWAGGGFSRPVGALHLNLPVVIVVRSIIFPVDDSYKKKDLIEACHSVELARLATDTSDWIKVDSWEMMLQEQDGLKNCGHSQRLFDLRRVTRLLRSKDD
uniref:Uncharacterized protein n=1 Tax=Oncorhynchus tshawytscha TaxID=74940 RepID=A0AAZ3NYT9_ONCTS